MMVIHFEELWEEAEALLQTETSVSSFQELANEATAKLAVFNQVGEAGSQSIKTHAFGKVLLILTQIAAKEQIDAYTALRQATDDRKIEQLSLEYTKR